MALQANPVAARPHAQAHRSGRRGHRARGTRSGSNPPAVAPQEFEPPTIELTPPTATRSGGSSSSDGRPGPSEPTLVGAPAHSSSARLGSTVGRGGPSSLELRPAPTTGPNAWSYRISCSIHTSYSKSIISSSVRICFTGLDFNCIS